MNGPSKNSPGDSFSSHPVFVNSLGVPVRTSVLLVEYSCLLLGDFDLPNSNVN